MAWVILIALQFRYTFYRPQIKRLRARKISLQHKIRFDSRISCGLLLLRFPSHSLPSPSDAVHRKRSHVVQVSSLVRFFTRHFVPRSPFGRRSSVALRATCRAPARLWLAVIDFQNGEQQSRSGSDKKRRNRLQ